MKRNNVRNREISTIPNLKDIVKNEKKNTKTTWNGLRRTAISFYAAKRRCTDKLSPSYPRYGAKGIKFKFKTYHQIIKEIGPRPFGTTLDRINSRGHYERGNIQWSTPKQQQENTVKFKLTKELIGKIKEYKNKGLKVGEIAWILGLTRMTASRGFHKIDD